MTGGIRILLLTGGAGAAPAIADAVDDARDVAGLDEILAELTRGTAVDLVAIDVDYPQPLAAAREIAAVEPPPGISFLVAPDDLETMQAKLAFVPELDHPGVVRADRPPDQLGAQLRREAEGARQRRSVRRAVDVINRNLLQASRGPSPVPPIRTVSERYLATLLRHAPELILSVDPDGRVVTLNPAGGRALGLDEHRAEGAALQELLSDEDPGQLRELLDAAAAGQTQVRDDLQVVVADGRELVVSATAAPIPGDAGGLAGLVVIARDVTDERRTQERLRQLQKAQSLATLASGVAHDFNNLLVTIRGWANIAATDPEDPDTVRTALSEVEHATQQAADLARSMLAYSGRGEFEPRAVDLSLLVEETARLATASVSAKIDLRLELAPELPAIEADPTQIRQVLMNLVINAAEAIGGDVGAIRVRTSCEHLDQEGVAQAGLEELKPGSHVVLEVEDTGPGIAERDLPRLFDPFFTTKFAGRGLGLAASHGIVRAHGGAIVAGNRPGDGAVFRILLPAREEGP